MAGRARVAGDYYARLELDPDATEAEIRRAYRRLALQWHPDRNPHTPDAGERFKAISEAYAVLIDPAKREAYDRARQAGARGGFRPSREDLFRDLFADPRASVIFEELARELARVGLSVDRRDFQQTLFGGRAVIRGRVFVVTPLTPLRLLVRLAGAAWRGAAAGRSRMPAAERSRGVRAGLARAGRWLLGGPRGEDIVLPLPLTPAEAERGGPKRVVLGRTPGEEAVLVTIPPRVRPGTRLRLRGKGRPVGARQDRGDAYLVVEIAGPEGRG